MESETESIEELLIWVVSVDRRLVLMKSLKGYTVVKASDVSHETGRSTQNSSRALKELDEKGLIKCLAPGKITWKKYVSTDMGKDILNKPDEKHF